MSTINIGYRIRNARKAAQMTQSDLANKLGKSLRTIQKYESGEIDPSWTVIEEIASSLNIPLAEFIFPQPSDSFVPAPPKEVFFENDKDKFDYILNVLSDLSAFCSATGLRMTIRADYPDDPKSMIYSFTLNDRDV